MLAAGVVFLNLLAAQFFFRLDLTEDRRYSIAPATKTVLKKIDDVVYVEVYLEGDLPPGFRRLQGAIRETLEEFRVYGGANIQYKFVDPSAEPSAQARNEFYQQLAKKGLQPTNLHDNENGRQVERIIFPGALVRFGEKEEPVLLLKGNQSAAPEQRLNQSVEGVEYELVAAIRRLTQKTRRKIAFLEGHGELPVTQVADLMGALQRYYDVTRVDLRRGERLDSTISAVVIARPTQPFTVGDQYKLDQFVLRGGRLVLCLDPLPVELDSVGEKGTFGVPIKTDLDELLFRWGARVNPDLLQDLVSQSIPMVTGIVGNQPTTQLVPWRFFPIINSFSKHPIVRNLDVVSTRFVSSIDTIAAPGIRKTPLLFTSRYTRILPAPVRVNFNEARLEANPRIFNRGPQMVGVLLEGSFTSIFQNRLVESSGLLASFIPQSRVPTRIAVFSDGDLPRNGLNKKTGQPEALGYDKFVGVQFANRELLTNTLDYLLDEDDLLAVRGKEVVIRPLDRPRVQAERTGWQLLNTVVPLVLLVGAGLGRWLWRRRKYERA
ncbi:MAG: gliding motility-associated ABC transporter substrate-binding protein GldG [Hymenobacteraceae bacterium]|nr:gliding motility-associated ABC transporter substrate-binding protein GldG [Hymenobacteraceae bacterium]